jgi:hypothetical protein
VVLAGREWRSCDPVTSVAARAATVVDVVSTGSESCDFKDMVDPLPCQDEDGSFVRPGGGGAVSSDRAEADHVVGGSNASASAREAAEVRETCEARELVRSTAPLLLVASLVREDGRDEPGWVELQLFDREGGAAQAALSTMALLPSSQIWLAAPKRDDARDDEARDDEARDDARDDTRLESMGCRYVSNASRLRLSFGVVDREVSIPCLFKKKIWHAIDMQQSQRSRERCGCSCTTQLHPPSERRGLVGTMLGVGCAWNGLVVCVLGKQAR